MTQALGLLRGKSILIVEDAFFLDGETRRALDNLGVTIAGPVSSLSAALSVIVQGIDAAIVDLFLDPETAFTIIEELEARAVPYVFALPDRNAGESKFGPFVLSPDLGELAHIAAALFSVRLH